MDPDHSNWLRISLLHHVAAAGDIEKAKLLIDHGAKIDCRDEEYHSTPLGLAARCGRGEMVKLLLTRGAAMNLFDDEPWATPLAWAERRGQSEIATLLETHGAR